MKAPSAKITNVIGLLLSLINIQTSAKKERNGGAGRVIIKTKERSVTKIGRLSSTPRIRVSNRVLKDSYTKPTLRNSRGETSPCINIKKIIVASPINLDLNSRTGMTPIWKILLYAISFLKSACM